SVPRSEETSRMCALTREVKPIGDLIRFVVSPEGEVVPDTAAKAEARGVWISLGEQAVAEAVRKKAFARSLKENVRVPDVLAAPLRRRLTERLRARLPRSRKAGQIVTGASKVKAALEAGGVVARSTAADAAPDGRQKMAGSFKAYRLAAADEGIAVPE